VYKSKTCLLSQCKFKITATAPSWSATHSCWELLLLQTKGGPEASPQI
jgi:hypothetical protein